MGDAAGAVKPILVTGASGNVGQALLGVLARRGMAARAAVTRPVSGATGAAAKETVRLDYRDPSTFGPAVRGCGGLFLLRPPAISNVGPTLNALCDVARAEGVEQVVFLSVAGAERNSLVPHHAVERHLQAQSSCWTILRPGFFAQNLADAYARDIGEDDRIFVPAGRGRVAWIDLRDVAEVAALAFAEPRLHDRQGYTLTGPEAVDFDEVARLLTASLGRSIRYVPASLAGYALHLRRRGLPWMQVIVQSFLHAGLRRGNAERVDPTLERLLGRPGRTVAEFIRDHVATWDRAARQRPTQISS